VCEAVSQVPTLMEWRSLWSNEATGQIGGSNGTWPLYRWKIPNSMWDRRSTLPEFQVTAR